MLSFGMQIGITKLGIDCLRFAEAVSLILIVYLLFLSITKRIIPGVSIIFPVVIFMALPAFILTGGIYWFSAASSYVWGVPFFLTATYITHKNNELSSVSVLLLSVSALFHEQMAVAAITFHVCYFVILAFQDRNKIKNGALKHAAMFLPVFLSFLFVVLAPGNMNRKHSSVFPGDTLGEVVLSNAKLLCRYFIENTEGWNYIILVLMASVVLSIKSAKSSRKVKVLIFVLVALDLISCVRMAADPIFSSTTILFVFGALLALTTKINSFGRVAFCAYMAAMASVSVLLFSPGFAGRSLIPFYLIMMLPIAHSLISVESIKGRVVTIFATLIVAYFSVGGVESVYRGYEGNYAQNSENNSRLEAFREDLLNAGGEKNTLLLLKLHNDRYGELMPYQRPVIDVWIRKYYSLPPSINIVWVESGR